MKIRFIKLLMITLFIGILSCNTQTEENSTNDSSKESMDKESKAVENVLKSYRDAIQNLTVENTDKLFTEDSQLFESGGSEGRMQLIKIIT